MTDQQQLEQNYAQQQNFFFETISKKLKSFQEKESETFKLLTSIQKDVQLTSEQFELVGCLSYLVGMDFVNQPYMQRHICDNVYKRFEDLNFSAATLVAFTDALELVSTETCQDSKNALKDSITQIIPVPTENKLINFEIRNSIKAIINNSMIPVNMAVSVNKILVKKELDYHDVLQINALINRQCKFNGLKAIKAMKKLYDQPVWRQMLEQASIYFDNQKYAIIYLDQTISVKEAIGKFDRPLIDVLDGTYETYDFTLFESLYEESQIEEVEVDTEEAGADEVEKYQRLPEPVAKEMQGSKPFEFLLEVIADFIGHYPKTAEDIFKAVDAMIEQTDYIQNIYHYLKVNLVKVSDAADTKNLPVAEILAIFETKVKELASEYKVLAEKNCAAIPEDYITKVVNYVDACIGDLLIITDEQKQYLISQVLDNGISTYKHLAEILDLIEKCDINGNQLISYVVLNQYLADNTNITEIFEAGEKLEPLQLKLSIYAGFADLFLATTKPAEVQEIKE